jgi:hypothetical protein
MALHAEPHHDPAPIDDNERISRFVFDRRHFSARGVKFRAFEPPSTAVEVSVTRTNGLSDAAIWRYGDQWIGQPANRTVLARGDFTPRQLGEVGTDGVRLSLRPDDNPPRHANIIGWPAPEHKEIRRSLAQQLAAKATCVVRSEGT